MDNIVEFYLKKYTIAKRGILAMKNRGKEKVLRFMGVGAFAVFMFATLTACGKKTINVTETLSVKFDGCNGYGVAELENEYAWESEAFKEAGVEQMDALNALANGVVIESAVSYEVSPKENLSNGDEVTVRAVYSNEAVEDYNIKFTASEKKFVVEGLPDVKQVDLFENIDVAYKGIAPNVTASIVDGNTDSYVLTTYALDKSSNLNVGDVVTVTVKYDKQKLLEAGYMAESDTKEFQVSGVASYVTELSEIPEDVMGKMKRQMEDALLAHTASNWSEKESLVGMNFLGNYLLLLKSGMSGSANNMLYLVYKIDVNNSEDSFSYYTYCRFNDLILLEDGTCSIDLSSYKMPHGNSALGIVSGEAFVKGSYYYLGYEQIESLFNNCVTANIENYEYESNIVE